MRRMIGLGLIWILFWLGPSACRAGPAPESAEPTSPTPFATLSPPPPDGLRPSPFPPVEPSPTSPPFDLIEDSSRTIYRLAADLDFESGMLRVEEQVDYLNDTGTTLERLVLILEPARFVERFRLESSIWLADQSEVDIRTIEDGIVHLSLPAPLKDGERAALELAYTFELPRAPGKLSLYDDQVHLGDWYAFAPVFRSPEGWLAYRPNPVGETLAYDVADFEVQLEVHNAPEDLQVAASAPGSVAPGRYAYQARGYRNFALAMSPDYVVQETKAGDTLLYGYALSADDQAGDAALLAASSALGVFSDLFRPYPHPTFTLVAGNFPDGLEFDGLAFISQDYYGWYTGSVRDYLPLLAAHEVAHQWWLFGVGSDQAIEPWLDEALSIYSELLWLEQFDPELVEWWWIFRVATFEPLEGNVNDTVYQYGSFRPYVNAIYLRGARMMRDLRREMGDEAFFEALQDYTQRYWGAEATGEMFMELMESHDGEGLDVVWQAYFRP